MEHHDSRHAKGEDVHEIGGSFKDDGVGKLHASSITSSLDAGRTARYSRWRPYEGAQRQQVLAAYCLKISKSHVDLFTQLLAPLLSARLSRSARL